MLTYSTLQGEKMARMRTYSLERPGFPGGVRLPSQNAAHELPHVQVPPGHGVHDQRQQLLPLSALALGGRGPVPPQASASSPPVPAASANAPRAPRRIRSSSILRILAARPARSGPLRREVVPHPPPGAAVVELRGGAGEALRVRDVGADLRGEGRGEGGPGDEGGEEGRGGGGGGRLRPRPPLAPHPASQ